MSLRRLVLDTDQTNDAMVDALEYLSGCGIFVPDFAHRIEPLPGRSQFTPGRGRGVGFLRLGCYPTRSMTDWFVMHELAHVLVAAHEPERRRRFGAAFGAEPPEDYDEQQWKGIIPRRARPHGYPSHYARDAGGEEHFAELVAFMYTAPRGFASRPPSDLARSWDIAWDYGLARMT